MSFNYSIERCKTEIYNVLRESQLPIGVLRYIIKDVSKEIEQLYVQAVLEEQKQLEMPAANNEQAKIEEE